MEQLTERLRGRFPDEPADGIAQMVAKAHGGYEASTVRDFIPVLVERELVDRLRVPRQR